MSMHYAEIARQVAASGAISPEDVLALRRASWSDGTITRDEAEAIFAIDAAVGDRAGAEWTDFFVEALGEFVVNGDEPRGYVSEPKAAWLMAQVDRDGRAGRVSELELLVRVLERAYNSPAPFKAYVLARIERAVTTGEGPTRCGGELRPGHVTEAEARLLRRVLFAPAGEGPAGVGRGEAELLFRLKDASLDTANAPEWKRLFVQGVANYLMGAPHAQITRDRAVELDAFIANTRTNAGQFLKRMVLALPGGADAYGKAPPERDRFAELRAAEQVTDSEQAWLDSHIAAGGEVDEYEQALLDFLAGGDI